MSSDDAYSAFLDKANQDSGGSERFTESQSSLRATSTEVPKQLQQVEKYFSSETDEPFEPVSFKWEGKDLPSESEFQDLVEHDSEVSILDVKEFDPHGHYGDVVQAVEDSGNGKARVFRVAHGRTRVSYYVVVLDKDKGRVVGMKAKSVES
ncbi:MAG: hypothetical protein LQ351_001755 [Letrouitia transgressa]|nr:MAG: hypothetical protein LQ351_001755 [Letrouitia transgressa]